MDGLVIAGNYDQFRHKCLKLNIDYSKYKYLGRTDDIRGRADTTLFLIGDYWNHPDYIRNKPRLLDYCDNHNIRISHSFPD